MFELLVIKREIHRVCLNCKRYTRIAENTIECVNYYPMDNSDSIFDEILLTSVNFGDRIFIRKVIYMEYCAHIRETDNEEQSVREHLLNTAALAEKYADSIGMKSTGRLAGLSHDTGKLRTSFDDYIHGRGNYSRGEIDHSYAGAKYIYELAQKSGDMAYKNTAAFIARTIISHHGLQDWLKEDGNDYFSERITKDEGYEEASAAFTEVFGDEAEVLLKQATGEYSSVRSRIEAISKNSREFAFYLGMLERVMESVLIDADRTNTADFMSNSCTEMDYDTVQVWENMNEKMQEKLVGFSEKTDRISRQRADISERCAAFADHKADVCRLIVPTGGGKTLSSMRYAIECCREYGMERIFYIAPFMSILEQNSDVIRSLCGDEFFLEHHSNVIQDIDTEDELRKYELRAEKWDKPVIATTMVQFLNALFLGKTTAVRRMHRLCGAVIIIDEVQSVPLKCVNIFNLAVNFLAKICGSTVVLCSATQPVFDKTEYPIIFDDRMDIIGDHTEDFRIFKRTELISMVSPKGYTYEEAADLCYEKYLERGSLLLVVNTKAAASALFKLLKDRNDNDAENKAYLLHLSTNMCPQHRRTVIDEARNRLASKEKVICVTTQLIEAGVDISFGCVVRSLAGMDNAAQAAGRCNRNDEFGEICPVYLINLRDENVGKLKEIKAAQDVSRCIIDSGKFSDLLSPDTMELYFEKYYLQAKNEMRYNVSDGNTPDDLIDLLSLDSTRYVIKKIRHLKYCAQAFKTAGRKFEVIDNNTSGIIVPYDDDANTLISMLCSEKNPKAFAEIARKAQKYAVNVYDNMRKKLLDVGAVTVYDNGIMVLHDGFYDSELGITVDGVPPEALIL